MPPRPQPRDVKKPAVQITNIVAKAQLVRPFNFSSLESKHPFDHGHKYDPKLVFHGASIFLTHGYSKFSLFRTGTVMSLASRSINELNVSFAWLSSFLSDFNLQLSDQYDIINIAATSDFFCAFHLLELATFIPFESFYDPQVAVVSKKDNFVDCITYYFHDHGPRYTALIFPTGKITLTGFKSIPVLEAHALELSSILSKISLDHPEVLVK